MPQNPNITSCQYTFIVSRRWSQNTQCKHCKNKKTPTNLTVCSNALHINDWGSTYNVLMFGLTASHPLCARNTWQTLRNTLADLPAGSHPLRLGEHTASKQPGREHASTRDWRTLGFSARLCCVPVFLRNRYLICTYMCACDWGNK